MVSFVIALLLVLYAVQLEQSARSADARSAAQRAQACWQPGRMTRHCRMP